MCRYSCRIAARVVAAFLLAAAAASANVTVRFEPASLTVDPGTIFSMAIVADIPQPLVGWGLDLTIQNPAVVSVHAAPSIGPLWVSAYAPDGDGLAGLAFPSSVSGTGVVLATLSLSADAVGETDLWINVTPGDLSEGFALDPTGFDTFTVQAGHVKVPEPATGLFLLAAGAVVAGRRRAVVRTGG